jgi:hypothetical protein
MYACHKPQDTTNEADSTLPAPNIDPDRLGDSQGMFPYVFMGENSSVMCEAYTMKFRLSHAKPMMPATNNNIPWLDPERYSEDNGVFLSYIHSGKELSLRSPNYRIEYINKRLPYCSSIDSIYIWLDGIFLDKVAGAEVLETPGKIKTRSGKTAITKAYRIPRHTSARGEIDPKYTAYAYLDYDKDYYVAFNLSAISKPEFDELEENFWELVKSFELL